MHLEIYQYSIPFRRPFKTGNKTYENRKGLYLLLKSKGIIALGEAAPLPGFSKYGIGSVTDQLLNIKEEILQSFREGRSFTEVHTENNAGSLAPSLLFALDSLYFDYSAQKKNTSLPALLFDEFQTSIPLNGVISVSSLNQMVKRANQLVSKGFKTLKFKTDHDIECLIKVLEEIRSSHPDIILRIDANGCWETEEAVEKLNDLDKFEIAYCEEPLNQPTAYKLEKLNRLTNIPIALDESVTHLPMLEEALPHISFLILKPMVIGNFYNLFATKRLADHHDITTVFTSSLESGIGRMMTAILASGLGSPQIAHGLATGSLLTLDVWSDGTYINNGSFSLPDYIEVGKEYEANLNKIPLTKL